MAKVFVYRCVLWTLIWQPEEGGGTKNSQLLSYGVVSVGSTARVVAPPSRKNTVFAIASGLNRWVWRSRATTPWAIYRSQQALDTLTHLFYRCLTATWGGLVLHPHPSALPFAIRLLCVALRPFRLPPGKFPQSDQRDCSSRTFPNNIFYQEKCSRMHFPVYLPAQTRE